MEILYILTAVFIVFGIFIGTTSHNRLVRVYRKYFTSAYINITAGDFVKRSIIHLDLPKHSIGITERDLSDGYSISRKMIILSKKNYYSKTVSAIAVAAHELGHAIQHKNGSKMLVLSFFLGKVSKLNDLIFFPGLILGLILAFLTNQYADLGQYLVFSVIILYALSFMLKIVNIPLEIDASKKALGFLRRHRILDEYELKGAKKVLSAAAYTYFGSLFHGIIKAVRTIDNSFK